MRVGNIAAREEWVSRPEELTILSKCFQNGRGQWDDRGGKRGREGSREVAAIKRKVSIR